MAADRGIDVHLAVPAVLAWALSATDPALNRAFVAFRDARGVIRGATSIALSTRVVPP